MGDGLAEVAVEALLAVVAVPARRVVPAVEADAAALAPRQLVQLHVEAAAPRVQVAVAGWERQRGDIVTICAHPGRCQPRGAAAKPSVCALSDRGVTGCEALVAPLAVGSQLLAHVPSWPVLGGERSFLEGKMRLPRPHFAVLTCNKYGFASACPQCGLQVGCEDGGPSLVREWSTQTPVAPSALPQTLSPWKHRSSPFSSTLTLCCYCSVQRSPDCCETPTSQHRRSPLCPVGRGFHHHLPDFPSIPTLTSSNTRV